MRVHGYAQYGVFALALSWCHATCAAEVATSARLKTFAATTHLPAHDVGRTLAGSNRAQLQIDARGHVALTNEHWRAELDGELTGSAADALRGLPGAMDPFGANDGLRAFDGAIATARTDQRAIRARIDRLLIGYRDEQFAFVLGRQAVSWGNGLVFQPFDLFNPFAPTETDRDYKVGDDLALAEWTSTSAQDLQVVILARRTSDGKRELAAGSVGAKWQQPVGFGELNVLVAQHAGDGVFGLGWNMPIGESVARLDWVVTRLNGQTWRHSLVLNADRSFVIATHNLYTFAEIYRNGFGASDTPRALSALNAPLRRRLQRGEVFTVSRWYGALGATLEWNPLWKQTALLIVSAQDRSALLQSTLRYEPDDRSVIEGGITWGVGSSGDEFAGIPVAVAPRGVQAPTSGGGINAHLRMSWYW